MSRLQAGGLALCMESGLVCVLIEYFGGGYNLAGKLFHDNWLVEYKEMVACDLTGELSTRLYVESKKLIPLGDKQTQDELQREKELELV